MIYIVLKILCTQKLMSWIFNLSEQISFVDIKMFESLCWIFFHDMNKFIKLVRRIMLSWFVKINDDQKTLKNSKSKTWFEFLTCYKNLIAFKKSSFEFVIYFDVIFYQFLAIVELFDFETFSKVLMCRTKWFNSLIMHERDVFLNLKDETNKIIDEWRFREIRLATKIYQMIEWIERQIFDEKFYYHLKNLVKKESLFDISNNVNFDLFHTSSNVNLEFINTDFLSWCRCRRIQKIKRVVLKTRQKLI
jgi:hypothetical protein